MRFKLVFTLMLFLSVSSASWGKKPSSKANLSKPIQGSGRPVGKSEEGDFIVEKRSDGSVVKYKKKTTYDFEGTGIEGLYNKPSGAYISNIKEVKGKSVIRVRENFDAEVIDSARMLK
ncbi:MAG: hypothetical protein EB078_00075 [Proteobacteria bacterium]|nr:hypothetical protein [Pseudomonadota bacterium]NDD03276.1 hypothetical protein [Pseudomonadota bacterium]